MGPRERPQGGNDICGQKTCQRDRFSPSTPALRCGFTLEGPGPGYADFARPERVLCPRRPGRPPHDGGATTGARHNLDRIGRTLGYLESRGRAARAGVDSEPTGQSPSGLEVGRSWYHLKRCKWVLGSTSTMSLRPTDGCPSAGAAVLGLMVRRGFTSRTRDNWSVRCDGLMRSR